MRKFLVSLAAFLTMYAGSYLLSLGFTPFVWKWRWLTVKYKGRLLAINARVGPFMVDIT